MTSATFNRSINTHRPLGLFASLGKAITATISAVAGSQAGRPSAQARQAAAVRRMADRHRQVSPGFASDLYAAADRHEFDHSR